MKNGKKEIDWSLWIAVGLCLMALVLMIFVWGPRGLDKANQRNQEIVEKADRLLDATTGQKPATERPWRPDTVKFPPGVIQDLIDEAVAREASETLDK